MPRRTLPLTDSIIRYARPRERVYALYDGGGLRLEVRPNGGRYWRLKYRHGGRTRYLHLGIYPAVPLREARELARAARGKAAAGMDPGAASHPRTFGEAADEWMKKNLPTLAPATADKARSTFARDLLPWLGGRPIAEIEPPELLDVLRRIEARGAIETAHRARQRLSQVFRYAVACGYARRDPTADLRGALPPVKVTHRAAITDPAGVRDLLRAVDGYWGSFVVKCALRLLPLTFIRPGELRESTWSEIDFDRALWSIPAPRTKMRRPHLIPLSRQAVEILRELYPLTHSRPYIFGSDIAAGRPISENTLNQALRRMGFAKEQMTSHGFRATASTLLHEMGYPPHVIEAQLSHAQKSQVAAAYNRAAYLPERVRMMQEWADYLDQLRR